MKSLKKWFALVAVFCVVFTACAQETATTEAAATEVTTTEATTEAATTDAITETTEANAPNTNSVVMDIEKEVVNLDELKAEGKPIYLQISQDGCKPCEEMIPIVKKLRDEFADRVIVQYVDAQQNLELAYNMGVQYTPTQVFITESGEFFTTDKLQMVDNKNQQGDIVPVNVGFVPEETMREVLEQLENAQ